MKIKKTFYIFPLLAILILPNISFAQTINELKIQIENLLRQIQQLQEQINTRRNQQIQTQNQWCYNFNRNLKIEMVGNDIANLHIALEKEGFVISETEKKQKRFGETTASAISGFQVKYKEEILNPLGLNYPTGYVGVSTRKKLNSLYGCDKKPICLQVITSARNPKTGECKEFNTPCDVPTDWIKVEKCIACPVYPIPAPDWCKNGKIVDGGRDEYGCARPPKCILSTDNQPPTIYEVSGPMSLKINEIGTWIVKANDPEQGILTYSVIWGDELPPFTTQSISKSLPYNQTATFTHSYSKPGIYTVIFVVTDEQGLYAKTSITVKVEEIFSSFITVLSPNGGENLSLGQSYPIKWKQSQDSLLTIWLRNRKLEPKGFISKMNYYIKPIVEKFNGKSGENAYIWEVNSDIPPASGYEVCIDRYFNLALEIPSGYEDCSDAPFAIIGSPANYKILYGILRPSPISYYMWGSHILMANDGVTYRVKAAHDNILYDLKKYENLNVLIAGQVSYYPLEGGFWGIIAEKVQPTIVPLPSSLTVISPNGGEVWFQGSKQYIKVKSSIINKNICLSLYRDNAYIQNIGCSFNVSDSILTYEWLVPSTLPIGDGYKIFAKTTDVNGKEVFDFSDASFSIVAPTSSFNIYLNSQLANILEAAKSILEQISNFLKR